MLEATVPSHLSPIADVLARALPTLRAVPAGVRLRLSGLKGAARAFFLSQCLIHVPQPVLCLLTSAQEAEAVADDLRLFLGGEQQAEARILLYPPWDVPAFEGLSPSGEVLAAQIEGLYA